MKNILVFIKNFFEVKDDKSCSDCGSEDFVTLTNIFVPLEQCKGCKKTREKCF